jgi:hypothetical protein
LPSIFPEDRREGGLREELLHYLDKLREFKTIFFLIANRLHLCYNTINQKRGEKQIMERLVIDRIRLRGVTHRMQTRIAERMRAHPSTITRKIRGDTALTIEDINLIAEVCGTKPSDFVMFTNEEVGEKATK